MACHLIFIGAPGSGKGTQSAKLANDFGMGHVSTGELLRAEVESGSVLGTQVKAVIEAGKLVSDDLVLEMIKSNVDLNSRFFIFDGFPRNIEQAKMLDDVLGNRRYRAVYFKIDTDKLVQRLTSRRVSEDGKYIYNLISSPPKTEGICDVTGQKLIQRKDDKEEVIRDRMRLFHASIDPMLDFYKSKNSLIEIDADQSMDEVFKDLAAVI